MLLSLLLLKSLSRCSEGDVAVRIAAGLSGHPLQVQLPQDGAFKAFRTQSRAAVRKYHPPKSDFPVVVIRAEARGRRNWLWSKYWPSRDYGWSRVARVLRVIKCPGDHVTIIHPEHREHLVASLREGVATVGARSRSV